jgi:hypothetical protein
VSLGGGDEDAIHPLLGGIEVALEIEVQAAREEALQAIQPCHLAGEADQAIGAAVQIAPFHDRLALRRPQLAVGEEAAEVPIAGAFADQHVELATTGHGQVAADDRADPGLHRRLMKPRRAVDPVAIAHPDDRVILCSGVRDEILGQGSAAQERERTAAVQLDVVERFQREDAKARRSTQSLAILRIPSRRSGTLKLIKRPSDFPLKRR